MVVRVPLQTICQDSEGRLLVSNKNTKLHVYMYTSREWSSLIQCKKQTKNYKHYTSKAIWLKQRCLKTKPN